MAALSPKIDIPVIKDVAEHLKVTERTIYRLPAAKKLSTFEVGYRRVDQASVGRRVCC